MRGCSTVFHVAGVNAMCLRDPIEMVRTNVEGSAKVVRAAADAGVRRVVYTSSSSAIGEPRHTGGREDTPPRGSYLSAYERSKHLAERRVFELAGSLDLSVVSVNPSSVQGPGRATGSARLLLEGVNGRPPFLVATTLSAGETRGTPGQRYLLWGASLTTREAVDLLDRIWGLPRKVRFAPDWFATVGGEIAWVGARALRRDPTVCPEAVRTLLHGHHYDGSRAVRELGLRYTPVEKTMRPT